MPWERPISETIIRGRGRLEPTTPVTSEATTSTTTSARWRGWLRTSKNLTPTRPAGNSSALRRTSRLISQNNVEAIGAATFGDAYKGKWEAGVHAAGDVRSYALRYYECAVARVAGDINNPSNDTSSWKLAGSAVTINGERPGKHRRPGGYNTYGDRYKGLWVAGVHAAGDYRSYGGRYYLCKAARSASDTDDPTQDNTGWEPVGSSFCATGPTSRRPSRKTLMQRQQSCSGKTTRARGRLESLPWATCPMTT